MNDRELLELAAKAAGLDSAAEMYGWCESGALLDRNDPPEVWNPLTDDADALRLAVALGLSLVPYPIYGNPKHSVIAKRYDHARYLRDEAEEPQIEEVQVYGGDPYAATRRAITRAAAEIGRQMT